MFRLRDGPAPPLRPMVASDGRMHSTGEQPLDHIASVHHTHSACFARCLDNGLSMKTVAKRVLRRCRHLSSGTDDGAVVGLERTVIAAYSAGLRRSWGWLTGHRSRHARRSSLLSRECRRPWGGGQGLRAGVLMATEWRRRSRDGLPVEHELWCAQNSAVLRSQPARAGEHVPEGCVTARAGSQDPNTTLTVPWPSTHAGPSGLST